MDRYLNMRCQDWRARIPFSPQGTLEGLLMGAKALIDL